MAKPHVNGLESKIDKKEPKLASIKELKSSLSKYLSGIDKEFKDYCMQKDKKPEGKVIIDQAEKHLGKAAYRRDSVIRGMEGELIIKDMREKHGYVTKLIEYQMNNGATALVTFSINLELNAQEDEELMQLMPKSLKASTRHDHSGYAEIYYNVCSDGDRKRFEGFEKKEEAIHYVQESLVSRILELRK